MRLVQVAKALGMTGQELRHELTEVDFGVKPSDREIPDGLAQGIIRFVARKHGKEVDMEALGFGAEESEAVQEEEDPEEEVTEEKETVDEENKKPQKIEKQSVAEPLKILRKLTLEDVSKEAIKKQEKALGSQASKPTKAERDAAISEDKDTQDRKMRKEHARSHQQQIKKKDGVVLLPPSVSVKEFAEKAGVQVPVIIQSLMANGIMTTVTQSIDYDTAAIIAAEIGIQVQKEHEVGTAEDIASRNLEELLKDEKENLSPRAPIVVVMGHVDHGKTAILDAIRDTDVVSGEAGGITQHIGAYQVEYVPSGGKERHAITFLDTPGHEAFTAMRARGAQVTDIAVIVVSAEEGVKPTTVEAINHAKEAGVPILVAINKIDKENSDPDKVKGELASHDLQPEEWGGKTPTVLCSAKTKQGIDDLLDHIVLLSDIAELKANPDRPSVATVIESHLDSSLGPLATVIVNTGTLYIGDPLICGATAGKVRTMMDARGKRLQDVGPSGAVRVSGFDAVPLVGDILQVMPSEQEVRALLGAVKEERTRGKKRSFADLVSRLSEGKLKHLKVVLKADAQGSLEALQEALAKKTTDEVSVKVIHGAIGTVTETDVMMAAASDGIVFAFHAPVPANVSLIAEREGVQVREYDVVYTLLDDVEGLLSGLVEPEEEEKVLGHLEVKVLFLSKKNQQIVGGKVKDGVMKRLPFRCLREGAEVGTGKITSLKHGDKDIKEAKEGTECGMRTESSVPVLEGDVLEVYLRELKKKS
jgi:translation initiation factor IF-2